MPICLTLSAPAHLYSKVKSSTQSALQENAATLSTMSCVGRSNLTIKVKFALKSWLVPKQLSTVKSTEANRQRQTKQRHCHPAVSSEWVSLFGVCLLLMPFSSFTLRLSLDPQYFCSFHHRSCSGFRCRRSTNSNSSSSYLSLGIYCFTI